MSRNFEQEYKEYLNEQAPDIWSRIEAGVDARIAEEAEGQDTKKSGKQTTKKPNASLRQTNGKTKSTRRKKKLSRQNRYLRLAGSIAACFAALVLAIPVFRMIHNNNTSPSKAEAAIENVELENATITNTEIADAQEQTQLEQQAQQVQETAGETGGAVVALPEDTLVQKDETAGETGETPESESAQQTEEGAIDGAAYAANQPAETADAQTAQGTDNDSVLGTVTRFENVRINVIQAANQADGSILYTALIEQSSDTDLEVGANITCRLAQTLTTPVEVGSSYTVTLHMDTSQQDAMYVVDKCASDE